MARRGCAGLLERAQSQILVSISTAAVRHCEDVLLRLVVLGLFRRWNADSTAIIVSSGHLDTVVAFAPRDHLLLLGSDLLMSGHLLLLARQEGARFVLLNGE